MSRTAESRKGLIGLIVLGMILSTFTTAVSVVAAPPQPKLIPNISLAAPENWWDSSWQYRKPVTITNSGSSLTDYQMLFTVDTASLISAGKMRSDVGDLRFTTSAGAELSYWIESGVNTSSTKVWVKVSSIPAGNSTVYMYYGNSSATSASDGNSTFLIFDDFNGDSIDNNKWVTLIQGNGSATVSGGKATFNAPTISDWAKIRSVNQIQYPAWAEMKVDSLTGQPRIDLAKSTTLSGANNQEFLSSYMFQGSTGHWLYRVDGSGNASILTSDSNSAQAGVWKFTWSATGAQYGTDGTYAFTTSDSTVAIGNYYVAFGHAAAKAGNVVVDWVRVRKYASTEPGYSFGGEDYVEGVAQSTSLSVSPSSFTKYSGETQTLTATLTSGGSALSGKTISWSTTSGTLSASSGTTNTSGQVTVTYTAPTVTSQTAVTVTASFAGDASYLSSSGTSSGTINPMAGYWSLNETSGSTASDSSGMGNNGTVYGATWTSGKVGNALNFDGVNDYVSAPGTTLPSTGALTLAAWIKLDAIDDRCVISRSTTMDYNGEFIISLQTGKAWFTIVTSAGRVDLESQSTFTTNSWYFVVGVYDGSNMSIWLNGVKDREIAQSGTVGLYNVGIGIGVAGVNRGEGPLSYFDGIIDEVRIYSRALSGSEISTIYQDELGAVPSTSLSVSPSSFTLSSGGATTLTATLTSSGSAVANKTISWSMTSGSISSSSGTTNSSGQVTVTYTAPTVTAQTSVTVTASFAGDASYQSSSGTSSGYGLETPSTTLTISPSSFTLSSAGSTTLTATLTSGGSPVAGKTITWSTTAGTLSPSSGTTNTSGQVTVTYTAPTVTSQTSASITVSFAGDTSYQSSSVGSSGTITAPLSTTLSISPSTFTLEGGSSVTLTATLTAAGNALTGKMITWSATSGALSATSGATVTYTAPTVTTQTSVTVTASFAGDASYSGSQASSVGTITTMAQTSTSIVISPLVFDAKSEENVVMTILLTGGGVPVAGKTVTLSTTTGSITPSSATTGDFGTITAMFTAPSVEVRTSFIITASFAGDNEYSPTPAYSTGTVLPPELAETVERLENTMTKLEVSMEDLASKIEKLTDAIAENRIALGIIIEEGQSETEYEHPEIDAEFEIKGTNIEVRVDSLVESGKTVLVNIDNYTKTLLQLEHIAVWVDGQEIKQADDYDDVLDPTDDGDDAEYLILAGGNGVQVLVSIPHFSARTITIGALPTQPFAGEIPVWVIVASALALVIAMTAVIWHHLRESRGETTSMLIEKGLPKLRIEEVEVVREMRSMGEFTIPDLMQRTGSSKILAWRTVQKLMKKGLVEPTEEVKPPATGRGKPSMVFKYVGD